MEDLVASYDCIQIFIVVPAHKQSNFVMEHFMRRQSPAAHTANAHPVWHKSYTPSCCSLCMKPPLPVQASTKYATSQNMCFVLTCENWSQICHHQSRRWWHLVLHRMQPLQTVPSWVQCHVATPATPQSGCCFGATAGTRSKRSSDAVADTEVA